MGFNLKTLKNSELIDEFYSIQLTGRGAVAELENKIASYYQMKHALCVSNATTGLLGLALALNLKDSEFITSPYTYGGTVSSWLMLNNSIVFGDIEPLTATLNPEEIPRIITAKTKAVLAVDILGNPSNTKTIRKIADDFGLWYIADAAQSFGAERDGYPASYLADALVISFTNGKTLFAGEGGAIVTNNSDLYEKLLWYTQHPFRQKRELGLAISNEFSFNGRINPMAAIWANVNFEKALKRLKSYQKECLEVIECLDKSGLTETADFNAERILPSFFRLTTLQKKQSDGQKIERYLTKHGFKIKTMPVPVSLIYQNAAFLAQYKGRFSLPEACLMAECQVKQRVGLVLTKTFGENKK